MPLSHFFRRAVAVFAMLLLWQGGLAEAQQPAPETGGLTITIIDGDNAIMNVRQRVNREAIVQVEDENHRPVAGALVLFTSPGNGPSATFINSSHSISLTTDAQGRVALRGITPNKANGKFEIRIKASKNGQTATTIMTMTNQMAAGAISAGLSTKVIIGMALVAVAGIVIGVTVANSGGGKTATAVGVPPIILQPGTPGVGAPR